ncbi:unnamed protein product [Rhizoctonia solani]|uniref:Transmembrane protein n=1 Tax=Rhizoctonia solani TaxID=456999 RepID=A0A8H2XTY4_9AGAM|nr:unnamed protein product [Rhizoctonia solani]
MSHRLKPMHGRPIRSHNLRRRKDYLVFEQDVPRVYPYMLGYGGMGIVDSEEVTDEPDPAPAPAPALQASPSFATGTVVEQPPGETEQISQASLLVPTSTSSIEVTSITTTPTPSTTPTSSPVSPPTSMVIRSSSLVAAVTVLATSETPSSTFSSTSSSIEVVTSVLPVPSSSTTTAAQTLKEKRPYALYIAFGLMILTFICVLCASVAWIIRRRRRERQEAENQQWIGSVLNDEPDDKDAHQLERGRDMADPGMAGIGAVRREATYPPLTPPLLSSWHLRDTPSANNGNGIFGAHYGLTQARVHQPWRHSSLLQRGGPIAIDGVHHGLDGGGLTFRQDPNGGLIFDPRGTSSHQVVSYPNPHAPLASTSAAPSHYSYGGGGPFAVTNLLPGDISSRASETSLGRAGRINLDQSIPPGLGNNTSGGPARSLGLPIGPLDDPNPWRRYEGVENRGGMIGTEDTDKGWGATIKPGIYSAVGRIVGNDETKPIGSEETRPVEREKDRFTELVRQRRPRREWKADSDASPSECSDVHGEHNDRPDDDTDCAKAITLADSGHPSPGMDKLGDERPVNWLEREPTQHMIPDSRGWIVEEFPGGSKGKIHIVAAGARDRILRRLGSNASVATWTTVYSTDTDPVFSSESTSITRANTIATSRRDTISTRNSGCVGMDRSRGPSTASSDWGTPSMAKALEMSFAGRARDGKRGH